MDENENEIDTQNDNVIDVESVIEPEIKNDDSQSNPRETSDGEITENSEPLVQVIIPEGVFGNKHYERIGFSMGREANPAGMLLRFKEKEQADYDSSILEINKYYKIHTENLENQIKQRKAEIEILKEKYADIRKSLIDLKEHKTVLEGLNDKNKNALKDTSIEIGLKKKEIISDRIESMFSELHNLNLKYLEMIEDKYKTSKLSYDKNKEAISHRLKAFNVFEKYYNERYEKLSKKISILFETGISDYSSKVLLSVGYAIALVAGWYYSIYSLNNGLNSDSVLFFFISTIFNFSTVYLKLTGSVILSSLLLYGGFVVFLLFVTFIVYLCDLALAKLKNNNEENSIENVSQILVNLKNNDQFQYTTKIDSSSIFSTWVSILPYALIAALVFVILSVGRTVNNPNDIQSLDASLSGHFAGSTMALAMAALAYFYMSKIIEPRILKNTDSKVPIRYNFELAGVILLFVFGIIIGVLYLNQNLQSLNDYVVIKFGITVFVTAVVLGYGWYYRSLISEQREAEKRLSELSMAIRDNSRPFPSKFVGPELQIYSKKYLFLLNQIMNLMAARNASIQSLYKKEVKKPKKNTKKPSSNRSVFARFVNIFTSQVEEKKKQEKLKEYVVELSTEDKVLFPDLENKLIHLQSEFQVSDVDLRDIKKEIKLLADYSHPQLQDFEKNIERKQQSIRSLTYVIAEKIKDRYASLEALRNNYQRNISKLDYGYNIGYWWSQEKINPDNKD